MESVILILTSLTIASTVLAAIFFLAWKTMGRQEHALTWSIAFVFAACQWGGNLVKPVFPTWNAYWLTVNAFSLIVVTLAFLGFAQRAKVKVPMIWLWMPALLAWTLIFWTTVVSPHAGIRLGTTPGFAAAVIGFSAFFLLKHSPRRRPAEWGAATMMTIFALIQTGAAIVALMQGAETFPPYTLLYSRINFIAMPGIYMGMAMFVIFILASDIAEEMKLIAVRDELTGLLNRRGFIEAAEHAFASAKRSDCQLSVIMTDIDKFKTINDEHGHHVGDDALVHFASVLTANRRADDILARVGGEEFAIVLPGCSLQESYEIADDLCRRLAESPLESVKSALPMTASFGVAIVSRNDLEIHDVLRRADSALYRSKRRGRNRVDLESSQGMVNQDGALEPV